MDSANNEDTTKIVKNINYFIKEYSDIKHKQLKIKLFGVGILGHIIADKLSQSELEYIDILKINYNKTALLQLEKRIKNLLDGTHILFIVTSNNKVGKTVSKLIIKYAEELGISIFSIVLLSKKFIEKHNYYDSDITFFKERRNFTYAIPETMVTKNLSSNATLDNFTTSFSRMVLERIFCGVLKRMVNVDNEMGEF